MHNPSIFKPEPAATFVMTEGENHLLLRTLSLYYMTEFMKTVLSIKTDIRTLSLQLQKPFKSLQLMKKKKIKRGKQEKKLCSIGN